MELQRFIETILDFIARYAGLTLPRIVVSLIGVLICILIVLAIWNKRVRFLGAFLGLSFGLILTVVAIDIRILHYLMRIPFLTRARIMMSFTSLVTLIVTIEAIRRSHLQEKYALLWIITGLITLITGIFPQLLDIIGFIFGTQYATSAVGILFIFLLLITFHFSIAFSDYSVKQSKIAQRCAILEQRLIELEKRLEGKEPSQ